MLFTLLAILALMAVGVSAIGQSKIRKNDRLQIFLIPREVFQSSGKKSFEAELSEARHSCHLIENGNEFNRLNSITQHVINTAKSLYKITEHWDWQVAFINKDRINANQRPCGYLMFYSGLWRRLNLTDDEFAMIVAHEVAHAVREHGRESASYETIANMVLGRFNMKELPKVLINKAIEFGYRLPFSREQELEADALGMEIAMKAGFDPRSALILWRKFEQMAGEVEFEYFSSHPKFSDRLKYAQETLNILLNLNKK